MSQLITGNLYDLLSPPLNYIALIIISILSGALVGQEREKKGKSAGFRTTILVCLGATVFTMISIIFGKTGGDSGRIAAQIVTGVGFLGAGAILHGLGGVRGMTTAATIWAIAATGMVIGSGFAGAGVALSLAIFAILSFSALLEMRYMGPCSWVEGKLIFDPDGGKTTVMIDDVFDEYQIPKHHRKKEAMDKHFMQCSFKYCNSHKHHKEFLSKLASISNVKEIKV